MKKTNKRGGFYWVDGVPYPSVTAIIGIIDKPALRYWFGQQVYRAFSADPKLDEKGALSAPWKVSGSAKDRGTTVHSIVESWKHTKKQIKTVPKEFRGYAEAFYSFVEQNKIELVEHEKTVINKEIGYAGTLDLVCKFNGNKKKTILDVKTGKGLYPEVQLQLSAYRAALGSEEGWLEDNFQVDIAAVCLKEDGTYQFEQYAEDRLEEFKSCLTIWRWQNADKLKQLKSYGGTK